MKRLISILKLGMALLNLSCDVQVKLGSAEIRVPAGWRTIVDDKERINILSPDERQRATVSFQHSDSPATSKDFKRLCEIRQGLQADTMRLYEYYIFTFPFLLADKLMNQFG